MIGAVYELPVTTMRPVWSICMSTCPLEAKLLEDGTETSSPSGSAPAQVTAGKMPRDDWGPEQREPAVGS